MNIIEELGAAKVVGITGHIRPDGDCTGSVLGLYNYLKDNAPDIDVNVYLEQPSDKLSYLNGFDAIKNHGVQAPCVCMKLQCVRKKGNTWCRRTEKIILFRRTAKNIQNGNITPPRWR